MAKRSFPVYDFAVNGIRMMLENIRLFVLTTLAALGTVIAMMGVMALVARPMIGKIWSILPLYREQLMACSKGGGQCSGIAMSMWREIIPLLTSNSLIMLFCALLALVVFAGLALGFFRIVLDIVQNGASHVSRLFSSFHLVPKFLVSSFLVALIVTIGFALFVIPGIFMMLRLRFFYYYIVDKNDGVIECLKKSYHATCGLEWDVLALVIVSTIFMKFTFLIGAPASCLMIASAYSKLPKKMAKKK